MNSLRLLALAASFCTASAAFAISYPNLLVNGGFDSGPTGGLNIGTSVSSFIPGWQAATTSGTTAFTVFAAPGFNEPNPVNGNNLLNIGGYNTTKGVGVIWQDFATIPGETYHVSLYFGRTNNNTDAQFVGMDATIYNVIDGVAYSPNGVSPGNAWATGATSNLISVAFNFTALGNTSRLLIDDNTQAGGASLHLDAVSVTGPSPIPEPSAFAALAGLGVLGLAATRRRRAA